MPKLVLSTDGEPQEFPLGKGAITIGREPENDIQLDWPDVSRRHCKIEPLPQGGYRLLDLGSKNGTFLNGRQITAMALEFDDRLRVGEALLVYADDDATIEEALKRGSDEGVLHFPLPDSLTDDEQTSDEDLLIPDPLDDDEGTWRRRRTHRTGPHTRASNRSYLKERLVRLGLLSQNIASELDLTRLMDTILDEVLDFTGFERGLLLLADEDTGRLNPVLGRNMDHEHLDDASRKFSRGLVEDALAERQILCRTGIQADDSSFSARESVVSMGLDSALCIPLNVPLRVSGRPTGEERRRKGRQRRILGAIYLDSTFPIRKLDGADLKLLEAVAAQAAIALQNARLHYQATTDPLTGLSNRGFMGQAFEEELRTAREQGEPLGVLILDLDHFKRINDTYGHGVGDEVLKRVAQRLRRALRRDDYSARWGGEEFMVLLPGEGLEGTQVVADKIADAIRGRPIGQAEVNVTASFGIAIYPDHGDNQPELIRRADQALYAAKANGRNQTVVFSPELDRVDHRTDPVGSMLYADPAHTHRNLSTLFNTIEMLSSDRDPVAVLERALDNICDLTRARRAMLFVPEETDPEDTAPRLVANHGRARGGKSLTSKELKEFSRSAVRIALQESRSVLKLDSTDEQANKLSSASIDNLGLNTVMAVPLMVGDRTVGALYADDTTANREFSHMDLTQIEVMAKQLALSLAAKPDLLAAARGVAREELDETTRLRREVARLKAELESLKGEEEPAT